MRPALLLVDLQQDFLSAPGLVPRPEALVGAAQRLLLGMRDRRAPVMHCWTTVRDDSERMPHWKREGKRACVEGSDGHAAPPALRPQRGEPVLHKRFFDPFAAPGLEAAIADAGADTLIVAGIYLHACVRAAALGGYERGLEVWVAADAVGSDEPVHAQETRRWLEGRVATFLDVARILERVEPAAVGADSR
jgi:nicotinamidase-related amidase